MHRIYLREVVLVRYKLNKSYKNILKEKSHFISLSFESDIFTIIVLNRTLIQVGWYNLDRQADMNTLPGQNETGQV